MISQGRLEVLRVSAVSADPEPGQKKVRVLITRPSLEALVRRRLEEGELSAEDREAIRHEQEVADVTA